MNAFSLFKVLTLVCFLMVGRAGLGQSCDKMTGVSASTTFESCKFKYPDNISKCVETAECLAAEEKNNRDKKESDKESKSSCTSAVKAYDELNVKSRMACSAFDRTSTSKDKSAAAKCAKNIANCRAKVNSLFTQNEQGSQQEKSGFAMLQDLALQSFNAKMGVTDSSSKTANQSVACVKDPDSKERKNAEEKRRKEIKDLEDKIKKEVDEQAKLLEKQREKITDIKKKVNEVEADAKKELLKKDAKEREQTAEVSKSTIDSAKKLRTYAQKVTKAQQALARERFNYQNAMLDLSSEKISAKCKQEFESLKAAIVNTKVGDPKNTTAEQKQIEALAAQYKGKVSGTASLASLLTLTKKTCFEKANTKINEVNLNSSQNIQMINSEIEEAQQQIADEKKIAENNKANIEAVKKGMTEEKAAEEKEKLDKLTALNQEVIDFQTSTTEKINIAKAQAEKLQNDIKNLKLKTDFDVETAFDEAEGAIGSAENARSVAIDSCKCGDDPKNPGENKVCTRLINDKIDLGVKADIKKESTKN